MIIDTHNPTSLDVLKSVRLETLADPSDCEVPLLRTLSRKVKISSRVDWTELSIETLELN